jgi:lipoprotein signal peptidase
MTNQMMNFQMMKMEDIFLLEIKKESNDCLYFFQSIIFFYWLIVIVFDKENCIKKIQFSFIISYQLKNLIEKIVSAKIYLIAK